MQEEKLRQPRQRQRKSGRIILGDTTLNKYSTDEPFISAFQKLADQNLADKEPAAWIECLLHSHPSISRRIARARAACPVREQARESSYSLRLGVSLRALR